MNPSEIELLVCSLEKTPKLTGYFQFFGPEELFEIVLKE